MNQGLKHTGAGPLKRRKRLAPALMTWGMLATAAGVMGVFMYQAAGFGEDQQSLLQPPPVAESAQLAAPSATPSTPTQQAASAPNPSERFALAGSEVAGFDDEQQPYTISARSARQDKDKPNLVHMDAVSGKLRRADGRKMDITATNGRFNSRDKSLALTGNVSIMLENAFTARMAHADVDVQRKSLRSDADVLVEMDTGQIFSSGIEVSENGAHVLFRSRVRAQFEDTGLVGTGASQPVAGPVTTTKTAKGNLQ